MVFAGPSSSYVVRHGRHGSLGPLREDLEAEPEQLAKGPAAVLRAMPSRVVDSYLTRSQDAVQVDIDQVETSVFSPRGARGANTGRMLQAGHGEFLELERAVVPLGRPLHILATEPMRLASPRDTGVLP